LGSEFLVYLRLGFEHISDIRGYDHILFIAALTAVYQIREWRHLLWLVTAFTVGHSVTLALATLDIIRFDQDLIEFLIPVTIFLTSVINIAEKRQQVSQGAERLKYAIALGFGLIHGMGFSNFLRAVLGEEDSLFIPLLSFNLGLEVGQICIVFCVLFLAFILVRFARMDQRSWILVLSGATAGIALTMIIDKLVG